jgi:hypothetical protein
MSKFSSPIPVQTKIVDNLELSIPWKKWFQSLGNDWVSSNKVLTTSGTNFNYVISGVICFYQFTGTTSQTIDLPYTVGSDSLIDGVVIPKGTKTITLSTPSSGFYFIQF